MDGEQKPTEALQQIEVEFKRCPTCGLMKAASEFSRSKRSKDGLYWECRTCKRERDKRDYQAHKDKRLAKTKEWKEQNPEKVRAARKDYKDRRLEREREARAERRRKRIEERGLKPWEPPHSDDVHAAIQSLVLN